MSCTILFDVNETLLDLSALDAPFEDAFGRPGVRQEWFALMLHTALVSTATEHYADFATLGRTALEAVAHRHGVALDSAAQSRLLRGLRVLPPHPEVQESLARLQEAGARLAALTNSTLDAARAKLRHAGLLAYFDAVLSADAVKRLKPAPASYRMAAECLGVALPDTWFVAAHDWDIAGATRAGCRGAFVARPGKALGPLVDAPAVIGPDLRVVVDEILLLV